MSLTFFWRCEGTTLDGTDDFTAGDSTAAANNTPSISATAARYGTNGILIDSTADRYDFNPASIITSSVSGSAGAVAFWFQFPTSFPGSGGTILNIRGNASANDTINITTHTGTGANNRNLYLQIRNATNGGVDLVLTGNLLAPGNWYFVRAEWDSATPHRGLYVYNTSLTLLDSITSSSSFTTNCPADLTSGNGLRFGDNSGTVGTAYIDNIFIGNASADGATFLSNATITSYTSYSSTSTTLLPTTGTLTLNGRTPTTNAFSVVTIREVLINEAGSPMANRTGMSLLVWYAGSPIGVPDLSLSALTTDANGTASWSLPPGGLTYNQQIFYVATDGGSSLSAYTCARMQPIYT